MAIPLALGRVALVLFAVALLGACTGTAGPTPIVFNEPLPADPGPDVGGAALRQQVFADGKVTFDEYERAMEAAIQCMRDAGFQVQGPLTYPDGPLVVEPGADPTKRLTLLASGINPSDDAQWEQVNRRCQAQWSYAIEQVYLRQFTPTQQDIDRWLQRAWQCLRQKGLPISSPPTEQQAVDSVALGCRPWEASN